MGQALFFLVPTSAASAGVSGTLRLAYREHMLQHVPVLEMTDHRRWQAVLARDPRADGRFFYAVTSTGVFCRPTCPSRRPNRERVRFFETASAAEAAGFRACLRCRPTSTGPDQPVARAVAYLARHVDESVTLSALAKVADLSPAHFQRRFTRALGVSPREYHAALRADRFRRSLRGGSDVTSAMYDAGYASTSRLYEAAPTGRGVAPSAYRRGGKDVAISYITARSPLGHLLVAGTANGVCAVKLGDDATTLEDELKREFPAARVSLDRKLASGWVNHILKQLSGEEPTADLPLDVKGTAFQWRVWRALRDIPFGSTRSYSDVAKAIGRPRAVRAVARACATNPVCLVVPCHRVVPKNGGSGGYRWGADRKRRLLEIESA
jgi:AraC family transcriptional regulator, regulatory protein of adaptative response / methylated-DNA-[protein]-cysteine methyltransferase